VASSSRRQVVVLCVLLLALVVVVWRNFLVPGEPLGGVTGPVTGRAPQAVGRTGGDLVRQVERVHLKALTAARPEPEGGERDPFAFAERAAPPPSPGDDVPAPSTSPRPVVPVGPPPPPPIALKFIGIVDTSDKRKIAVLSDGRNVFYGREGETVEGRYRIEHIGVESIEMAWVDGRGRQVIRLSGS
jgi:hypothetical protein